MKRWLAFCLAVLSVLCLAACRNNADTARVYTLDRGNGTTLTLKIEDTTASLAIGHYATEEGFTSALSETVFGTVVSEEDGILTVSYADPSAYALVKFAISHEGEGVDVDAEGLVHELYLRDLSLSDEMLAVYTELFEGKEVTVKRGTEAWETFVAPEVDDTMVYVLSEEGTFTLQN